MATTRPFAYNTGSTIDGTIQIGNIAIGVSDQDYSQNPGGVKWWMGPDEELGYVIANQVPTGDHPTPVEVDSYINFWRSTDLTDQSFLDLLNSIPVTVGSRPFTNVNDAQTWLSNNGHWTSYGSVTPTPTPTSGVIPTATPTPTPTSSETILETPTPTPSVTPTNTPTPSLTPEPVTGYSFNLIVLPYNFPATGNTIMNNNPLNTGSTDPSLLETNLRGIYWNSIDSDGIDRTSYFSQYTGQSVTITMIQGSSTVIYSGNTNSLKYWTGNTGNPPGVVGNGFVFGTGISVPPNTGNTGNAVLIQSGTTWTVGQPVYISVTTNGASPTPTPSVTPTNTNTPTPSVTATSTTTPTPTPSVTATNTPTPTPTATTTSASAPMTVTIYESSSNVVMSASGTVDLTGLTLVDSNFGPIGGGGLGINSATFICGNNGSYASTYSGFTSVPSNFGSGSSANPSSASGNYFGVIMNGQPPYFLLVPTGYTSGTNISSTLTFTGQTLSSLGLTNGTYTYTWSGGSIDVVVGGPAPTPTPTPSTGAVGSGWNFYETSGTVITNPPQSNGEILIYGGGPPTSTYNPNNGGGGSYILFYKKDSAGTDYTTQFTNLQTNGGTINITQNGNTATYVGGSGVFFLDPGGFLIIPTAVQTVTVASPFTYADTITITIS